MKVSYRMDFISYILYAWIWLWRLVIGMVQDAE